MIDYTYPGDLDPAAARRRHDDAVVQALLHLSTRIPNIHIVFFPQVHGHHRDAPYLERLAALLPTNVSSEVLSDRLPSSMQQAVFASAEVVLAGRYHPAVFAVLGAVPVACVAYEHKSIGLMEAAGLGHLVVPIERVTTDRLVALVDEVVDNAPAIREQLRKVRPLLRERALRNADLAVGTIHHGDAPRRSNRRAGLATPPLTPMAWMRWDAIERALRQIRPEHILEIGTGQGAVGWRLAQRAEYVGVEPDAACHEVARDRIGGVGKRRRKTR